MTKAAPRRPDIYLCGPMTGLKGHNLEAFAEAESRLSDLGYSVFNPGNIQDDSMAFTDYMRPELKILLETKRALVALPGWEKGVGSRLEVMMAASIGLPAHSFSPTEGIGENLFPDNDDARETVEHLMSGFLVSDQTQGEAEMPPHLEAADLVLGPRGEYYDHPYDNFQRTAYLWTGILYSKLKAGTTIGPEEVSLCLVALKLARETFRHKRDNIVDGHGYLITHTMVLERMQEIEQNSQRDDASDND